MCCVVEEFEALMGDQVLVGQRHVRTSDSRSREEEAAYPEDGLPVNAVSYTLGMSILGLR